MDQTPGAAPPPACPQLRTASRVGWGHLNLTALPLDPPPAPSGPAQTLRGDKPRCCSGGGQALSRAPSLHREDLPRALLGAGAARPPPAPPGGLGGVSFIFLNKTKWNLCLRAQSPAPGPCRAAWLCAGGAWEVSLGLAVVSLLLGGSAVTHQHGAGGACLGHGASQHPPSHLFMGCGGGTQGCFPPPSWPGAHGGASSYRCVY